MFAETLKTKKKLLAVATRVRTPNFSLSSGTTILPAMRKLTGFLRDPKQRLIAALTAVSLSLVAWHFYAYGQDTSGFPDGFDAVQAAPSSHKVIFENAFVRVLEVTVPSPGATEPMHHHRWPGFFLSWDVGGKSPHVRYHRPDGSVKDEPSVETPVNPGRWEVKWMNPEPMHAIEVVADAKDSSIVPRNIPLLRIEIKCHP